MDSTNPLHLNLSDESIADSPAFTYAWVKLRPFLELGLILGFVGSPCWLWAMQWWYHTQPQHLPVAARMSVPGGEVNDVIQLEVAVTPEQQAKGLAHRPELGDNEGMVFVVSPPGRVNVWMNQTQPLDLVFVRDGQVVGVMENVPGCEAELNTCVLYGSPVAVDAVVEIRAGMAHELGIKPQSDVSIIYSIDEW